MSDFPPPPPLSEVEHIQARALAIPRIPDITEKGKVTDGGTSRPKFEVGKLYRILRGEVSESFNGVGVFSGEKDVEM